MTVAGPSLLPARGTDFVGGVVNLVASRGVASAQFAAAARLLKLGAELSGPATAIAQRASAAIDGQGDALAAMAAGLGETLDVYA